MIKILGYRISHFIGGTKLIKWGPGASGSYIATMREELPEKETKTEESRAKRKRWRETKKVVMGRDRFLLLASLSHSEQDLLEIYHSEQDLLEIYLWI